MKTATTTKRVLLIALFVDFFDIVTNLVVAVLTGSAVIFAQFLQGISDFMGSLFLVIGHRQSRRPNDHTHPFGYGREVFFWSLTSAFAMFFLGSTLSIYRGYHQVQTPNDVEYKELALAILAVSTLTNGYALWQSWIKIRIPGVSIWTTLQESSQQLVKTALIRNLLGVVAATTGFVAFIFYELTGTTAYDGWGAIMMGLLMAIFALPLINQSRRLMVGRSVSTKVIHRIRRSVIKIPEVININRLVAVYIGNDQILVDLDVELVDRLSTTRIEEVLDQIKETIVHDVPETQTVQIDLNAAKMRERVTIEKVS